MKSIASRTLLTMAAILALGGCGGGKSGPASDAATRQPADPAGEIMSTPAPSESPAREGVVVDSQPSLPGTPRPISCSAEYGADGAKFLVQQCIAVSPATHPPCNVANSCAMMRNEIARSCALLDEKARMIPECGIDPISREAAGDTITRYYAAINAHDYAAAWQLWGDDGGGSEQTLDEFTKGFMQTRRTHVSLGKVSQIEGGAGSLYATVPVTVDAELDNGRRQHFTGNYTVRRINRGMGPSQGWHIDSATLRPS